MICPKCNNNNSDENAVCIFCGNDLKVQSPFELPVLKEETSVEEVPKVEVANIEQYEEKNIEEPQEEQKNIESKSENIKKTPEELKKDEKKANILCFVALGIAISPRILIYYGSFFKVIRKITDALVYKFSFMCMALATSLLIYVKVKYPKNKLCTVLLILALAYVIYCIVMIVLLAIACNAMIKTCQDID